MAHPKIFIQTVYNHKSKQPLKSTQIWRQQLHKHKQPNLEPSKYIIEVLRSLSYLYIAPFRCWMMPHGLYNEALSEHYIWINFLFLCAKVRTLLPGQEDKLLSPSGVIWGRKAGSTPAQKWSSGLPGNWFWQVGSVVRRFYYWLEASPKGSSLERFLRYQKKIYPL